MRKSHASASSSPPVTATPFTAPIRGFDRSGKGRLGSDSESGSIFPPESPNSLKSRPAQKAGSLPVRTSTSTPELPSNERIAFGNAASTSLLRAFLTSGRFRVIRPTPSWISVNTVPFPNSSVVIIGAFLQLRPLFCPDEELVCRRLKD